MHLPYSINRLKLLILKTHLILGLVVAIRLLVITLAATTSLGIISPYLTVTAIPVSEATTTSTSNGMIVCPPQHDSRTRTSVIHFRSLSLHPNSILTILGPKLLIAEGEGSLVEDVVGFA